MSIFTQIINGEIPAYKIDENEEFIAFLDIFPLQKGHTLVVPKQETDKAFDLPADLLCRWISFAQPIAKAIERAFECNRCGLSIAGLEVPHAHIHLIPISKIGDMNFHNDKLKLSPEEFGSIQQRITDELKRSRSKQ